MHAAFAILVFHLAFLGTAATVEDGVTSTAVFNLGRLVNDAEDFAQGQHTAGQTALARVQAMKDALAKKILNKEIKALPYTEAELGEGMAVTTLKDTASEGYDSFKALAKTIEGQKAEVEKKLLKAEAKQTAAEKKEMKSRKDSAELRTKLRTSKAKQAPKGQGELVDKLREDVTSLKESIEDYKKNLASTKKRAAAQMKKMKEYFDDSLSKNKAELDQQRQDDNEALKDYKKVLESHWYSNSSQINTYKKKYNEAENTIKDLEEEVKDNDRRHKEMEQALKADFGAKERDLVRKFENQLSKQSKATAGEKQKEAWDKEEVIEAKEKAKEDNAAMSEAVKANAGLQDKEKLAESKLDALAKKEKGEVKAAEETVAKLELQKDLEKVNENQAETKVSASEAKASLQMQEAKDEAEEKVKGAQSDASQKLEEMRNKLKRMQEKYATTESLQKANEKERIAQARASADEEIDKIQERKTVIQTQEQATEQRESDEKEKVGLMKEELERAKTQIKELERTQKQEEDRFKSQIAKDSDRIKKRAGARTMAQAEKQQAEAAEVKNAALDAALKKAVARAKQLAQHKDDAQKKADDYKTKLEKAEYKLFLEKKKATDLDAKLKKSELKRDMDRKSAQHDMELGEAEKDKDGRMEVKYKYEVKAAEALKQQVAMEQSKNAVSFSKSQKWEAKAQKYKQAMYAANAHARRIGARVRKEWAMKMIKEQDAHTKALLKLKHFVALRQAKHDAELLRVKNQRDSAKRSADKATAAGANQEEVFKYVAGMVSEQAVRGRVLRDYMAKMQKIRQKYNKQLGKEWKDEIKRLRKELDKYKNGAEIAKYKYKVMQLQHQLKEKHQQRVIKMEVKRSQELDIQTLLSAAIKQASKGSDGRSEEENRKRVDAAVEAVIRTVKAADTQKGKDLATKADQEVDLPGSSSHQSPAEMRATIQKLRAELKSRRKETAVSDEQTKSQKTDHRKKVVTPKQEKLLRQLQNLVKMSGQSKGKTKIETDIQEVPLAEVQTGPGHHGDASGSKGLGELRTGAFLSPLRN